MTEFMEHSLEIISDDIHILCRRYRAVAISLDSKKLFIASAHNVDETLLTALRFTCGRTVIVEYWPEAKIEQSLFPGRTIKNELNNDLKTKPNDPPQQLKGNEPSRVTLFNPQQSIMKDLLDNESDTPVIQFITQTLNLAIQKRASDIHFEPYQHYYRVRLRIDGVLHESTPPATEWAARIGSCLKVMAKLNIAERRLPQDGQLTIPFGDTAYSMRIATLPTQYGEKIVLRILQMQQQTTLEKLGMTNAALKQLTQALLAPQGLILVTGPTGSGKTITLYCSLARLNQTQRNICSAEDPIEIPVDGINQVQVNNKIGLDFSCVLRAVLRQDPDVIMVGEIRDNETASIAVKSAQTGHLVLSTLHTNSTAETLIRLTQMGIERHLVASSLKLVIAQRLVRRLCLHCRKFASEPFHPPANIRSIPMQHYVATGCEHCCSGYYGRTGVYEMLSVTPQIQQALLNNASPEKLVQIAQKQEQTTLFEAGLSLVEQGITSLDEINRVVGFIAEGLEIEAAI